MKTITVEFNSDFIGYQTDTPFDETRVVEILKRGIERYGGRGLDEVPDSRTLRKKWNWYIETNYYNDRKKDENTPLSEDEKGEIKQFANENMEDLLPKFAEKLVLLGF